MDSLTVAWVHLLERSSARVQEKRGLPGLALIVQICGSKNEDRQENNDLPQPIRQAG